MAECRYCHGKAGMFRDSHDTCKQEADAAFAQMRSLVSEAVSSGKSAEDIVQPLATYRTRGRLTEAETRHGLLQAADAATMVLAHNNPVSNEEAERLGAIFHLLDEETWYRNVQKMVRWQGYLSMTFSNTLYQVLHGQVPHYTSSMSERFFLALGEHPVLRRNATLAEYRTVSSRSAYQSVSIPVGGGVYYRIGASAPRAEQTGLVPVDQGMMLISTRAIYFSGTQNTFKIPYATILRLESFVDAIGVHTNHGRAKVLIPGSLGMNDGWFFYNLVSALTAQAIH